LTYLAGILPELAKDERLEWVLLVSDKGREKLRVPEGVEVKVVPEMGFWQVHVWEQLVLPWKCWQWRVRGVLCNANYVPLLAWRPMPIVHSTPKAEELAVGWRMAVYWKVLRLLTTLSLWRAPVAFSVARHVLKEYVGPRTAAKVRIVPSAVSVPAMEVATDANLMVTVGDFYPQKDYPLLIEVFRRVRLRRPQARLMIIGRPVDAGVRDGVLRLVRELKLAEGITLPGAMEHGQLLKTLAKAAVYVSTSRAECFNIPVLEALACGVPAVLPDFDFQREVAGDAALYVLDEGREALADGMAEVVVRVMEDKALRDGLVAAGKKRAGLFTWAATAAVMRAAV
jgi:glycosyltransferase involved in cell wall biosynthesis